MRELEQYADNLTEDEDSDDLDYAAEQQATAEALRDATEWNGDAETRPYTLRMVPIMGTNSDKGTHHD